MIDTAMPYLAIFASGVLEFGRVPDIYIPV